jgi:hypothetical protein
MVYSSGTPEGFFGWGNQHVSLSKLEVECDEASFHGLFDPLVELHKSPCLDLASPNRNAPIFAAFSDENLEYSPSALHQG